MPFRARLIREPEIVEELFSPDMSPEAWQRVRAQLRTKQIQLELPCCSHSALMRVSHLGLQHFYHKPPSTCWSAGETIEHLRAKLQIYRACVAAGWNAKTEWTENDWYATVLATEEITAGTGIMRGKRIAFQVQWSSKTIDETNKRQDQYEQAEVLGVWFFRRPPPQVQYRNYIGIDARREHLKAYSGLPLFYIIEKPGSFDKQGHPVWGQLEFQVYLNGRPYPLDHFVQAWLAGRIDFCPGRQKHGASKWCEFSHWMIFSDGHNV